MKVVLRQTNILDLDSIHELQTKCFIKSEHWYRSIIQNYLSDGYVLELLLPNKTKIIGVLLHGEIIPCNEEDEFIPENDEGKYFISNNLHTKPMEGITMICIHPKFRNKGLAKKLINKYHYDYKNKELCLNTRASNPAYNLYIKMGYIHIGTIKDKYFLPTENSLFMIKKII
jgi:ribosomal protein S18 acetylase RimI-like enzyme